MNITRTNLTLKALFYVHVFIMFCVCICSFVTLENEFFSLFDTLIDPDNYSVRVSLAAIVCFTVFFVNGPYWDLIVKPKLKESKIDSNDLINSINKFKG